MGTLSLDPQARLPAATMVNKGSVLQNPKAVARQALASLDYIRKQNPCHSGAADAIGPSFTNRDGVKKGVVKLGWSWEARYVTVFSGEEELARTLTEMLTHPGCSASTCIVQEWVDFDFEMRLYFLPPQTWDPGQKLKPRQTIYNAWYGSMRGGERRNFSRLSADEVLSRMWQHDAGALESAKAQALAISQHLLAWLRLADSKLVPMIRLDFMLKRLGPGKAQVVFGEYCEMGACCLGWEEGPPIIWRAALDRALE